MATTLKELPPVARNINLPCKKCGQDRFHVVLTHVNSRTAKVKCEVCGTQKTFKLPSEAKPRGAGRKRAAAPAPSQLEIWNDLNEKIGKKGATPYNLRHRFEAQTAIQHPKFGLGFITLA